jgi:hypothetical protein
MYKALDPNSFFSIPKTIAREEDPNRMLLPFFISKKLPFWEGQYD